MKSPYRPTIRSPVAVLTNDVEPRLRAAAERRAGDRPVGPEHANHRRHAGRLDSLMNDGIYDFLFNGRTGDIKAIGRGPAKLP
jgi:hypothetical protein